MKYLVTFLFDRKNMWIKKFFNKYKFKSFNKKKYIFKVSFKTSAIKKQNVVFPLSFTKKLSNKFLNSNKLTIIAHPSKLPKDKGFAPLANQILRGNNFFYITMIKASEKIDSGEVLMQKKFLLNGTELSNDLRKIQALKIFQMIDRFLIYYPKFKLKIQKGKSSYNKRRLPKDSRLDINNSIKRQFNLLRVVDNENYPAFFDYKKNRYYLKIFKKKS